MNFGKHIRNLVMLLVVALIAATAVSAVPVAIEKVKVNGDEIYTTTTNSIRSLDRGEELSVRVEVTAAADVKDAQIEVVMRGYDHDDRIEDITSVFDMKANRTYVKTFTLNLPYKMDKDQYKLRVRVDDRAGDTTQETYEIEVESPRHQLFIDDVIFSPSNGVVAGRALLTTVRIANLGSADQKDGVKVMITIPELGISAASYLDKVVEDRRKTSEELYLRIPSCIKPGYYDAVITVEYHKGDKVVRETKQIKVLEDETCAVPDEKDDDKEVKTIITIGPTTQEVFRGEGGVIYPLTISNSGKEARTYVITIDGYQDWADVRVSPANVLVLKGGESKAVYIYVSAKESAQIGEHMFSVDVSSGTETLKQFTLKSKVVEAEKTAGKGMDVKNVLLIGLLVLVVLLVILGLIIGFGKLKGKDEDMDENDEEAGQTYY